MSGFELSKRIDRTFDTYKQDPFAVHSFAMWNSFESVLLSSHKNATIPAQKGKVERGNCDVKQWKHVRQRSMREAPFYKSSTGLPSTVREFTLGNGMNNLEQNRAIKTEFLLSISAVKRGSRCFFLCKLVRVAASPLIALNSNSFYGRVAERMRKRGERERERKSIAQECVQWRP